MSKTKTVYIIEDSNILSKILALQISKQFDCVVKKFPNADKAMKAIALTPPDLIILDYNYNEEKLKYSNGLAFLVDLRKKENKTPVIVFSGQRNKTKAIELIKEGANDYINKDDDDFMEDLLNSINDVFNIQQAKRNIKSFRNKLKINFLFLGLLIVSLIIIISRYILLD